MNFDQLKAFHKIALAGGFTKAARELHLTQSAVSHQIQALEHSLGTMLFERAGRRISLTNEGKVLFAHTQRIFNLYNDILTLFESHQKLRKGKISFGATALLGTHYLPKIIGAFNLQYSGVEIDLRLGNSDYVLDKILKGEIEFGFAGMRRSQTGLGHILIHREPLIIIASPNSELASMRSVDPELLLKTPFIWREKGTQTLEMIKKWFRITLGAYPVKSFELENVEAAKSIVEAGYGITIVCQRAAEREINEGRLRTVAVKNFSITFDVYLFFLKGRSFSIASKKFLRALQASDLTHIKNLNKFL
jgi:DNA-binding transcriptional LysR family regulator